MKKTKNKKQKASKKTLLGGAAKSLKKLRKGGRLRGLSTTQKVVGGALVALGLGYLATRRATSTPAASDASAAEETLAAMEEPQA